MGVGSCAATRRPWMRSLTNCPGCDDSRMRLPLDGEKAGGQRPRPRSQIQLLVDRNAVLAAVSLVMIDVPPDIERLDECAVLIEEVDRAFEPAKQLDTLRMVGDERVHQSRCLVDEIAGAGHPVVLQV